MVMTCVYYVMKRAHVFGMFVLVSPLIADDFRRQNSNIGRKSSQKRRNRGVLEY